MYRQSLPTCTSRDGEKKNVEIYKQWLPKCTLRDGNSIKRNIVELVMMAKSLPGIFSSSFESWVRNDGIMSLLYNSSIDYDGKIFLLRICWLSFKSRDAIIQSKIIIRATNCGMKLILILLLYLEYILLRMSLNLKKIKNNF